MEPVETLGSYGNNSEMDKALAKLKFMAEALPKDKEAKEWFARTSSAYTCKRKTSGESKNRSNGSQGFKKPSLRIG